MTKEELYKGAFTDEQLKLMKKFREENLNSKSENFKLIPSSFSHRGCSVSGSTRHTITGEGSCKIV